MEKLSHHYLIIPISVNRACNHFFFLHPLISESSQFQEFNLYKGLITDKYISYSVLSNMLMIKYL